MVRPAQKKVCYHLPDAAKALGVHRDTMESYLKRGEIKGTKIGRTWFIPRENIDRIITPEHPETL
jgi:excisionase family DNA binding protein